MAVRPMKRADHDKWEEISGLPEDLDTHLSEVQESFTDALDDLRDETEELCRRLSGI